MSPSRVIISIVFLRQLQGHSYAVYSVRWHHSRAGLFLSCSADWSVKLWDQSRTCALFSFDLHAPVFDVAWAPFAASVFVASTADGRLCLYDLSQLKQTPVAFDHVRNARLTRVAFHNSEPVILVGDDAGQVSCYKLPSSLIERMLLIQHQVQQKRDAQHNGGMGGMGMVERGLSQLQMSLQQEGGDPLDFLRAPGASSSLVPLDIIRVQLPKLEKVLAYYASLV